MKIGLIAEFNPFHNGHKYLIDAIKSKYPNSYLIVALSSDYVQRGELAVASFEDRKKIALENGVDEVIELDFLTSTQAAHIFAKGSIDLLLKNGIQKLAFGVSDTDDINFYLHCAKKIKENLVQYNTELKSFLKKGYSFVFSSFEALKIILASEVVPADILGFEYVKYIVDNNLDLEPICIKRTVSHGSLTLSKQYASATYLRELLREGKDISQYSPMKVSFPIMKIEDRYSEFQEIVKNNDENWLKNIVLMSEGMENLFKKNIDASNYDEFVDRCTSRRYTKSRIKRVILYVLLKIQK
ncbi:nucleotidyltransferase [Metamycoplasma arthritidis]|uniref:Predicted nucleotidyltransferase n=1 Tax=Metamycoplasma arthritidis (strain 158L3-1) TaxID=243272 RepID=B3PN98_META1|nr:nucleotidyltransferase [Metamycoplasma arthritidis]ACF07500.1 predicted nucleotidyltransferase [Metamycoplasma arthritidis 158L3-1]